MKRSPNIERNVIQQFLGARKENEESFFSHPSYTLEKELLYWISQADELQAEIVLQKINKLEKARLSRSPFRSLQNSLICSCTLFARATIEAGVTPEYAFNLSDVFIRKIDGANDEKQLANIEYEMIQYFIKAIRDYQKNPYQNDIIDQAIHYIHVHILHPLSLKEIALETNVSPNYLSALFHEIVGIPLKEYINRKKIDESIYFLKYTDSSVLDIALLFNFCNQSYYTSLFKRFNGMTPKQYRQKNNSFSLKKSLPVVKRSPLQSKMDKKAFIE
ncbi:AraC family transcriptional regulator [Pseudogracilibacillus auburnensis]|uniref:AraC family transcriptional regulator n=1 Tax=Pseudogracilibacillus auburnensis TaxID=1494959 RepID=UPI001A96431A|nr:AraC family transcriptional regulator [Pseudogracilibacillus auburnensis]MBO1005938.1 helix-turn-helix transcriptional regulator [Pseudogracilibacillus auburnensis]